MSEVAAAVAPVSAPSAPNAPAVDVQGGAPQGEPTQAAEAQRIELQKLSPNARVVMTIDGQEVEMSAADAAKRLGRGESANKRYAEAAEMRRQHAQERAEFEAYQKQFVTKLTSPAALREEMKALGMSPRQIAEALIREEEADAALTPAERKLREYERREEERLAENEAQTAAQFKAEKAAYVKSYSDGFHATMTAEGVPEGHVFRDVLMPSLSRAAQHILQTEGREMTRGDARRVIRHVLSETGSLRPMSDEQRRAAITDADYEAWAASKRAARPQATPPAIRHEVRDPRTGKFAEPTSAPRPQNANGQRIVSNMSSVWGDKM